MTSRQDTEMPGEYDFSKGLRGKYAERYKHGTNIVKLDEDVATLFPDAKSVNDTLRALGKIIHQREKHLQGPVDTTTDS